MRVSVLGEEAFILARWVLSHAVTKWSRGGAPQISVLWVLMPLQSFKRWGRKVLGCHELVLFPVSKIICPGLMWKRCRGNWLSAKRGSLLPWFAVDPPVFASTALNLVGWSLLPGTHVSPCQWGAIRTPWLTCFPYFLPMQEMPRLFQLNLRFTKAHRHSWANLMPLCHLHTDMFQQHEKVTLIMWCSTSKIALEYSVIFVYILELLEG